MENITVFNATFVQKVIERAFEKLNWKDHKIIVDTEFDEMGSVMIDDGEIMVYFDSESREYEKIQALPGFRKVKKPWCVDVATHIPQTRHEPPDVDIRTHYFANLTKLIDFLLGYEFQDRLVNVHEELMYAEDFPIEYMKENDDENSNTP